MERRGSRRTGTEDVQGAYARNLATRLSQAARQDPTGTEQTANAGHNGIKNQSESASREAATQLGRSALHNGPSVTLPEERPKGMSLWEWLHTPN